LTVERLTPFLLPKTEQALGATNPCSPQWKGGLMIEQIHKQMAYRPFRPFYIETSGGTVVRVSRPEWIYFPPATNHFVVFEGSAGSYIAFSEVRSVLIEQPPVRLTEE
jgi:hypothetical protein